MKRNKVLKSLNKECERILFEMEFLDPDSEEYKDRLNQLIRLSDAGNEIVETGLKDNKIYRGCKLVVEGVGGLIVVPLAITWLGFQHEKDEMPNFICSSWFKDVTRNIVFRRPKKDGE